MTALATLADTLGWALPLLGVLLALLLVLGDRARARAVARAAGPRADRLVDGLPRTRRVARVLLGAALVALALAWSRAEALREAAAGEPGHRAWVLCLDVSRSMWARDVAPDRLGAARREIGALLDAAPGDRVALIAFAGTARLVSPLTTDHSALRTLLLDVDPTLALAGGTDLGAALREATVALGEDPRGGRVVLLTDGEDLGGGGQAEARALARRGARVDCVGVGTPQGGKIALEGEGLGGFLRDAEGNEVVSALDPGTLERLARAGGGRYEASEGSGTPAVHALRTDDAAAAHAASAEASVPAFQALLLLGILLLLLEIALGGGGRS